MKPLWPWAGSSRMYANLIAEIIRREGYHYYTEPMVGSGAVFWELLPPKATLCDIEPLNIDLYLTIRDNPLVLIAILKTMDVDKDTFLALLDTIADESCTVAAAAQWYYLLVLCYNGIVKKRDGKPYLTWGDRWKTWDQALPGRIKRILSASEMLRPVSMFHGDYQDIPRGDMAFYDPPWIGSGADYGVDFNHERLAAFLSDAPPDAKWILTINDCPEARDLYLPLSEWNMELSRKYIIAPTAEGRGKRGELLLTNFSPRMWG